MNTNREKRMIRGRVETRALTDKENAAGYIGALVGVIPLNTDSVQLRDRRLNNGQPFVERIAPKAFAEAAEVMGMAGHTDDTLAAFARQGVNLTLSESATELRYEALIPDTSAGRDLLVQTRLGIVRGTSFEFNYGAEDRWEKRADGTSVRTVTKGELSTVNPVVWPAYDDSELTVSLRGQRGADGNEGVEGVEARGYYVYQDTDFKWTDKPPTPDCAFALAAIGAATCTLSESLRYLREQPAGALVDLARAQAAAAADTVKTLADFLVAHGAEIDPAAQQRAEAKLTEARAAAAQSLPKTDHDRERRARILNLSSV